ncbi:ADP-ribose pyrophosphatase YjhB (NUDIX family) [Bacillus oleivorans]|uniref:ADP-ribose pyrophosphatase YjhB (NUDIX family) n=1 Tax=Bacillus oleivorans TaxID=1448271 RepID=A0A285CRW5_9BACI|nr:NUDIX hydrolase [Bacillus oleivorans]SNX70330.1 ADP-ribose pyrophosphatase YjhB (NUDIX family) [Bacillus oleivorans]
MSMPRHSLSAGAVVLNDEGKILLIRGLRRGWEFPGGVIELGETIQDGIIREVKEESGIDIEVIKFCGIYQNIKANVCATCWLAKAIGGEPQTSSESLEVGFFTLEEVLKMVTWSNFKERIVKILNEDEHPFYVAF